MLYVQLYLLAGAAVSVYLVEEIWKPWIKLRPHNLSLADMWSMGVATKIAVAGGAVIAAIVLTAAWPWFVTRRMGGPPEGM